MDICNGSLFWDSNKTWYSSWPEFTECFQYTVLVWLPCGWLWLTAPFYLYYLVRASGSPCSSYKLYIVKMVLCGILAAISTVLLVQVEVFSSETITAQTIAPSLQIVTPILAMLLMHMERRKGFITSGVLFIYWILLSGTGVVPFYTNIIQKSYTADVVTTTSFYAHYCLVLVQLLLSCFPDHNEIQPVSPEVSSSFPSRITFAWVTRLIIKGYKKVLTEIDIDGLHPRDRTSTNVFKFLSFWKKHSSALSSSNHRRKTTSKQQRRHLNIQTDGHEEEDERTPLLQNQRENNINSSRPTKDASLLKALLRTFWFDMIRSQIWKIFYDLLYFTNPLLLGELILFTEDLSSPSWKGYTLSVIMFTSILVQSVFYHATWHHSTSVALRIRAVLMSAIYRKALSMSSSARSESSSGEVVNLMSVDCEHIKNTAQWVWATWSSLFQVVLSLLLLYYTLGLSMLAGLAVMVLLVPFNYLLASKWQKYQVQLMTFKDSRMKIIGEVLNAMKIIKLYAWEPFFEERIADIRDKEIHFLWKISLLEAFGIFTWALSPYLVSLATLLTYVYTAESHYLDAHTAFVAVALLNNLGYAVNALPEVLSACVQAQVSLKRISKYLKSEDLSSEQMAMISNEDAVSIQNATFAWNCEKSERPHLQSISMNITRGSLVAVIGQVGDGKSSLLSALLGEMKRLSGTFCCKGSIAYVPQQAWIQNDTLQNNILFGKDLDRELYRKVLDCCALVPDLAILPAGDQTEIGERGINLSGGQKQRVSLARAVYNDADIYLLDDPLSAVDSHVGKHIFEELISRNGLLQNKTRILVTHGVQWLSRVDLIVFMSGGRIEVMGTYSQLQKRSASFSNYLQQCLQNDAGFETEDVHRLSNERSGKTTAKDSLDTSMDVENEGNIDGQNTGQLIDEEFTEEGKVTWSVYATYAKAIGSRVLLVCGAIYACYQAASVIASIWLSKWTDNKELANFTHLPPNSSLRQDTNNYYLEIYGGLGVVQSVCMVVFAILWASRTVKASRILHKGMAASILRAPMAFFDTTPTGRLINRFSQDIDTIDLRLQHLLQFAFNTIFVVLSCFIVISYSTPIFMVVVLPVCFIYYCVQVLYINTSRQLKRLESKSRSPIYSHFSETLAGVSVIRAMKQQERFIKESESRVDTNQRYIYYGFAAQRWLGFRLETLGNFIILAASMFAVASRDTLSGGIMGLTVSYALQITQNLYYVVKMISELETQAVSVERVKQYTDIEPEAAWFIGGCLHSPQWPWNGEVRFRNYSTRYRPGLDLILSDVSFTVAPGEKGSIAYVPQQAWIQNDTLQNNILFGKDLDRELYRKVLDCCALVPDLAILPAGDQTEIGERGINLSGGQKQRVSLARAVYNDADIYLLDDPLSAVDSHVGKHIFEELISRNGLLQNKTRILVTHGVQWLSRVDLIVFMSGGRIEVMGTYSQLQKRSASFSNYLQQCLQNDAGFETEDVHRLSNERSGKTTAKDSLDTSMDVENEGNIDGQNTGQLIDEEFTEEGKVTWSVYATYAKAIGSRVLLVCGAIYACYQAASVIASIWLSKWTDNKELANFTHLPPNSSLRQDTNNYYLEIYGGLGVVQSVCMVVFAILWASRTVKASRILHKGMAASILRAPMAFFDTTPTGRLINRFSQDIDTIDLRLQHLLQFAFNTIFVVLSCFIVISYSTPIFMVVVLPVCFIYYCVQVLYINTSRQLKRLESKSRSPIYSHFSETLAGVSVIRAMKQQERFIKESESRVDTNQRYIYYGFAAQRWLGFRLETLGNFIILAASMFAVASRDTLSGGIMGLTVSYALQITQNLYYVVKMISELETQAVSVERVKQYTDIEPEAAWFIGGCLHSPQWPWNGEVRFRNYSTRYRPGLDLILSDVSFTVAPGEKVGVVGRTGAGKSSLTLSLFRLIEAAGGEINIDGLDISSLGLHDLRKRLTILPQDPVLFSGSLRDNVDPFNKYSDSEIWTALDHAHLRSFVTSLPAGLQHECTEGGENISVGQRQLLCLARALLRKTKILVLDEATAAVDMETDDLIQQTLRSEFKDCTVLTIAHRLNTVMDYDRILVLDQGRVVEFDSPDSLVEQKGLFYKMTVDAGIVTNSRTVSS